MPRLMPTSLRRTPKECYQVVCQIYIISLCVQMDSMQIVLRLSMLAPILFALRPSKAGDWHDVLSLPVWLHCLPFPSQTPSPGQRLPHGLPKNYTLEGFTRCTPRLLSLVCSHSLANAVAPLLRECREAANK